MELAALVQGYTQPGPCTSAAGPFSWPQVFVTLITTAGTVLTAYVIHVTRGLDRKVSNGGE